MEGIPVHRRASCLRGEGANRWASGRHEERWALLQGPCARAGDHGMLETHRAGARSRPFRREEDSSTRCPRPEPFARYRKVSGSGSARSLEVSPQGRSGRACLAAAGTRARSEALVGCVHESSYVCRSRSTTVDAQRRTLVIPNRDHESDHFSRTCERGLAQSGEPRRAKRRRVSGCGGQTAKPTTSHERGTRKGARGSWESIDGRRPGSPKPLLFHEGAGVRDLGRARASSHAKASGGRGGGDGGVRGGLLDRHENAGDKTPAVCASRLPKRVSARERPVTHRIPTAQAVQRPIDERFVGARRRRVERHPSIARISVRSPSSTSVEGGWAS